jgi:hypothetical protein
MNNLDKMTNLSQWRESRIHEMDLPSGLHITLRDVTMTDLMLTGKLPASVVDFANDANKNGASSVNLKEITKNGAEFKSMLDALVEITLVTPLIGNTPDDTHITLDELSGDDKMAIFNFINREVEQIKSFREG